MPTKSTIMQLRFLRERRDELLMLVSQIEQHASERNLMESDFAKLRSICELIADYRSKRGSGK